MDIKSKFPKLKNLLGSYFYQDWEYDYDWQGNQPNFEEVILFYKAVNPTSTNFLAAEELRKFLALSLNEKKLSNALQDIGVFYSPRSRNVTLRQWLESILNILEDTSKNASYLREVEQPKWTGWEKYAE